MSIQKILQLIHSDDKSQDTNPHIIQNIEVKNQISEFNLEIIVPSEPLESVLIIELASGSTAKANSGSKNNTKIQGNINTLNIFLFRKFKSCLNIPPFLYFIYNILTQKLIKSKKKLKNSLSNYISRRPS